MKRLQKLPDETKLQHIMDVLDEDHDGNIDIDDAAEIDTADIDEIQLTESRGRQALAS